MSNELPLPAAILQSPPASGRRLALVALLGVIVAVLLGGLWLNKVYQPAARQAADAFASSDRSLTGLGGEIRGLDEKITALDRAHHAADARLAALEGTVSKITSARATTDVESEQRLRLARLENLIAIAADSVHFARDVKRADAALAAALALARAAASTELANLERALTDDRTALGMVREPDIGALLQAWRDLSVAVAALPWRAAAASVATPAEIAHEAGWHGVWSAMWSDLKGLIEIHDRTPAEAVALNPANEQLVKAALVQDFAVLRLATMQRDTREARAQATLISQTLSANLATDAEVTRGLAALASLATIDLAPPLPTLAASQAALQALKSPATEAAPASDPTVQ